VEIATATASASPVGMDEQRLSRAARPAALWAVAGLVAVGAAVRFATLGLQSYHHDEVITVMRVIHGSFVHMLGEVKGSESNPPLYYVLAWGWAKAFGSGEAAVRSLSALLGTATIPFAFAAAREAAGARAGVIAAALVALNPMLIWYSQEARSYALLVFFCAASLYFFLRALRSREGGDLALWALTSAGALSSHYFAVFAVAIEATWLLVALRSRWRAVVPAVAGVGLVGLALLPLLIAQVNPHHIGWIEATPLPERLLQTGVSFLAGETGHVIAEPPRERYALIPAALVGAGLLLLALRGSGRQRRASLAPLAVGLGVAALAAGAALAGKDYVVERNLLPALVPLAVAAAIGFAASGARRAGLACAAVLCAYWLAFAVYVDRTPNLQRPDLRAIAERLGPPRRPRAIVGWKLAADPIRFYLHDGSERVYSGELRVREIDVVGKPAAVVGKRAAGAAAAGLPPSFRPFDRLKLERATLTRYMSRRPVEVPYYLLRKLPTGFGSNGVVVDGSPDPRGVVR
jgi:mannosyltransferase